MMDHGNQSFNDSPLQSNLTKPGASRFSRRTALIGAGCLIGGGLCVGGGTAAFFLAQTISNSSSIRPSKSSGRSLFTYCSRSNIGGLTWSLDSQRIVSSGVNAQVWAAFSGTPVCTYTDASRGSGRSALPSFDPWQLCFGDAVWSPDGQFIAAPVNSIVGQKPPDSHGNIFDIWAYTVQMWNATNGTPVFTYTGHSDSVSAVAWSPDGKHIVSASWDNTVQVWEAANGTLAYTHVGVGTSAQLGWSPDGKRLFCNSDHRTESWDASDGSDVIVYPDVLVDDTVAWSPDHQCLAVYSQDNTELEVWRVSTGKLLGHYPVHGNWFDSSGVNDVAWSPDGKRIATSSDDKTVQVCDALTGRNVFAYTGHSDKVTGIAWSPDGRFIASASDDKTVQVWSPD
ncbi:WD40 repeat domain-containing protein [Ktedonobacter racemifer]|uniref:WD40 repeat, subgroup n=1 Tax=Ktedonobacter racemifer DSM 44963 TaxID=485913 RepID=D6U8C7_KTERA|nr:WD40 repeat domain-containing protein [Ktedonobacter racemifer]EFH80138.1 WD40 repeat, subgroup [Ktedonobacter racemifer DSM 44963]